MESLTDAPGRLPVGRGALDPPHIHTVLPNGAEVLAQEPRGNSNWARFTRIKTLLHDGTIESYFLKVSKGNAGREALRGEFEATALMHSFAPDFCPKPIAQGTLPRSSDAGDDESREHFYLCKFYDFAPDQTPEPEHFCEKLARMHLRSQEAAATEAKKEGRRPRFGFHCTTYNGDLPQDNTWSESWEASFAAGLRNVLVVREQRAGSPDQELDALAVPLFERVIPRLLRPLETDGRNVRPTLVHGDLWCGNAAVVRGSEEALVFDPASFWAHNEYELGNWRPGRNGFRDHIEPYLAHIPPSEPKEDWDDRNALYSVRFFLHAASFYPDRTDPDYLELAKIEIRMLVAKHAK